MQLNRSDLADFTYFLAVARHRNLRLAGVDLGVSASALSHALKNLETRLGVRLLHRTTRSITLTSAGEELLAAVSGPVEAIGQALDGLNRFRSSPTGRVRINIPGDAATHLLAPVLPAFHERYPEIELDVSVNNRLIDVIEGGFDAGIRFGGTVPEDMVTQRLSAEIRWVVVASPGYLDRHGEPHHPNDLMQHRCLKVRLGNGDLYQWDFERRDEALALAVPGLLTIDESSFALTVVENDGGLLYSPEPIVLSRVRAGTLKIVLAEWQPMGPAYYLYYSSRRQVPVGLRLLVDLIREMKPLGL